jgi:polyhydroxybutyrate depolymerase
VPILDFHGTADTTIPYAGNPEKGLPPIQNWLADWAVRDGCAPAPREAHIGEKVLVQRWTQCKGRGSVEHYQIAGLGHTWPSTTPNLDSPTPTVLDATPVIARFFAQHSLADIR